MNLFSWIEIQVFGWLCICKVLLDNLIHHYRDGRDFSKGEAAAMSIEMGVTKSKTPHN